MALTLATPRLRAAEPPPDADEILRAVRFTQTSQHETLLGHLRNGPATAQFRLIVNGPTVRYEFTDPPPLTLILHLGEKDARLTEVSKDGTEKISGAHWSDSVRGSDISFEDISLRFLYWPNAKVIGEDTMLLRKCWKISVDAPPGSDSQYGHVLLWIEKESGSLFQAEGYDKAGKFLRRFTVRSGQKVAGAWYLKQMRIEHPAAKGRDNSPTYLEIESVQK